MLQVPPCKDLAFEPHPVATTAAQICHNSRNQHRVQALTYLGGRVIQPLRGNHMDTPLECGGILASFWARADEEGDLGLQRLHGSCAEQLC